MTGGAGSMPESAPIEMRTRTRYEESKRQIVIEVALDPSVKRWATLTLTVSAKAVADIDPIFDAALAQLHKAFP